MSTNRLMILVCFFCVYVIWGSTYLAIRFAIVGLPPFLMASSRFIAAGLIMLVLSALRREEPLTRREKVFAFQTGLPLMLANAGVGFTEQWIPSGIAAVVVGAMPIWVMLLGRLLFHREAVAFSKYVGAVLGLVGVAMIATDGSSTAPPDGIGHYGLPLLVASSVLWAFGTQLQKNMGKTNSPIRYVMWQMLCGALVVGSMGLFGGESVEFAKLTSLSLLAWAYLVVFGSVVAFSCYSYLAQTVEPHFLSTYALVNPVIAVILGTVLGHESLTPAFFVAATLVLCGVCLLLTNPFLLFRRAKGSVLRLSPKLQDQRPEQSR